MSKNILSEIIAHKYTEVAEASTKVTLHELEKAIADMAPTRSLRQSLENHRGGIISEFKRRSPSKDWIRRDARVEDIIPQYEAAGAAALSILTDSHYFGGTLDDVRQARKLTHLPILRKEFIVSEYQILEARAAGADACLLIAAAIGNKRCHELAQFAHEVGLEVILEIHSREELEACSLHVDVIGVNNRNLKTFQTSPAQSEELFPLLPTGPLPISESGLLQPETALHLQKIGYKGFLIGEAFMTSEQPGERLKKYIEKLS